MLHVSEIDCLHGDSAFRQANTFVQLFVMLTEETVELQPTGQSQVLKPRADQRRSSVSSVTVENAPSGEVFKVLNIALNLQSILNGIRAPPIFIFQVYPVMVLIFFVGITILVGRFALERFGKTTLLFYAACLSMFSLADLVVSNYLATPLGVFLPGTSTDVIVAYWIYVGFTIALILANLVRHLPSPCFVHI